MAQPKKTEKATKIKRKYWYQIIAPRMFRNAVLGEIFIAEPGLALGRTTTQNLMNLTNDIKKQNTNINFMVDKVEGSKAYTKIISYNMIPTSIKRLTRRGSEKIELSLACKTSDNKKLRIKPLIFTRGTTNSSVAAKLNKITIEYLTKTINKMTFDNLINDLINHKLQSSLAKSLRKIHPLRKFEIKTMETVKEKKPVEEKTEKIEEKAEEKKKTKKDEVKKPEEKVEEKKEPEKKEAKETKEEQKPEVKEEEK